MPITLEDKADQMLICVDASGKPNGNSINRKLAHTAPGVKHLAIQVIVFDKNGNIILHNRPSRKVGGSTIDSPTTHVLVNETPMVSGMRCLNDEYKISDAKITVLGGFSYEKIYDDGSCENEFCLAAYAICGESEIRPTKEAPKIVKMNVGDFIKDIKSKPENYAVWLPFSIGILIKDKAAKKFLNYK